MGASLATGPVRPVPLRRLLLPLLLLALAGSQEAAGSDDDESCPAGAEGCSSGGGASAEERAAEAEARAAGVDVPEDDRYEDKLQCKVWAQRCECQENPSGMVGRGGAPGHCARSCALYGRECVDRGTDCAVRSRTTCGNDDWAVCAKSCLARQNKDQQAAKRCVRTEVPGGVHEVSIDDMFGRLANGSWAPELAPKVLSRDPWILLIEKFLTEEQIDALMQGMEDNGGGFAPSGELSADSFAGQQRRTSESLQCPDTRCFKDPRMLAVHDVITKLTGLHINAHELPQLVRYRPGQFYVTHQDTSEDYARAAHGHRIYTLFAYLSDVPEGAGGETHFPKLGLKVRPKQGAAVLWTNVDPSDPRKFDPRSFHESLPVKEPESGEEVPTKLAANLWLYGYDWRTHWKNKCMNVNAGY